MFPFAGPLPEHSPLVEATLTLNDLQQALCRIAAMLASRYNAN